MKSIYNLKDLQKPSFFQKLLKKKLPQNFTLEVNNLLAEKDLMSVTQNDVYEIANRYGNSILDNSTQNLTELYADFLKHCLADKVLSENELKELKHLKEILSLTDNDIIECHNNIVGAVYKKSLKDAVSDGKIDKSEEDFLNKLKDDLHLSTEFANKLSEQIRGQFVQDFFDNTVADERLSPSEEEQFQLLCKNLNVNIQVDEKIKSKLNRFKMYWVIENGEIPEINSQISLEKNEKCYFKTYCDWFEKRTVTHRINYSGTTASIKIMKGVRYRVGTIKPQRVTSEEWKQIDSGTMYLTSKRIIFVGQSKNLNIKLAKILSFTPYSDGVELTKDAGRNPLIRFSDNTDIFSLILSRLLND